MGRLPLVRQRVGSGPCLRGNASPSSLLPQGRYRNPGIGQGGTIIPAGMMIRRGSSLVTSNDTAGTAPYPYTIRSSPLLPSYIFQRNTAVHGAIMDTMTTDWVRVRLSSRRSITPCVLTSDACMDRRRHWKYRTGGYRCGHRCGDLTPSPQATLSRLPDAHKDGPT